MNASTGRIQPDIAVEATVSKPAKKTQIIAIYGKGGIGKSFTLANLSFMMAEQGKRVLLIGCDPKSDTTSLLFGGRSCPTIIETSAKKKAAGEAVAIGDVCFKRDGVFAMELGGPEVGRGCGGRGIIHGFELLDKLGFADWDFDFVLLDFLGDVVCGGFGLPIARDLCQKVIVVASNDLQSLYVANNVCSAVDYFRNLGGNVGVAGMVINKDDGTGEAQAFCEAVNIPILAAIPADDDIRKKSANYEIIGTAESQWGALFAELGLAVAEAPPQRPKPLTQEGLLGLFKGEAVGRGVTLVPASFADMCGVEHIEKPSSKSYTRGRRAMVGAISCHGGKDTLAAAAAKAGKSEVMARLAADYPLGPHDQPQSMCPAFGSLRVGLRMRRVAVILSGSACCVYGLTFTSHFYGARRSVGYVPFDSETLVTGQLYEDIVKAVFETAKPENYDAVVVINLCVPTASGVPLDLLPAQINGVRIIGIDVPGFGVPTHAEAKDVLAGAMLRYARHEAEKGAVARPRGPVTEGRKVSLLGEMFPADPPGIAAMLAPMGLGLAPGMPAREWRDLYGALDSTVAAAIHPFYTAAIREFLAAGRKVVGSAPVGLEGTEAWLTAIGAAADISAPAVAAAKAATLPAIQAALDGNQINARMVVSGYEGSELLVARALIEAGAEIPYVGTALPRTEWSAADATWLTAQGTHVQYRACLEQDVAAMRDVKPDLAFGTTPLVQAAKEQHIPAVYFTNMVSARPVFGAPGIASLAALVKAQTAGREKFSRMVAFF